MQKYISYIIIIVVGMIISHTVAAQQDDVQQGIVTFHKFERDTFFLRWSPTNASDWAACLDSGYYIDRKVGQGDWMQFGPYRPDFSRFTLPEQELGTQDLLLSLIYIESVPKEDFEESFPELLYSPEDIVNSRLEVVNFLISRHLHHILQTGLGEVMTDIKSSEDYTFIVRSACNSELKSEPIRFNTNLYISPPPVSLDANWANRQVELSWPTRAYAGHYYAYQLERSTDSLPYELIDSSRIMNLMDTSDLVIFHVYRRTEYLEDNDTEYAFRLRAFDYFGQLSEWSTEVRGVGVKEIGLSPTISYIDQLSGNHAKIRWTIEEPFVPLVAEWQIHIAKEWEGPYTLDTAGIAPHIREVSRPILYNSTFFRVIAIDLEGREAGSFPQMIMALDTTPPATPYDIQFTADTTGRIYLTWVQNEEADFYGYKVFASFDTLSPFVLRHEGFLSTSEFVDSIDLRSELPFIYYKIIAADERNNRSPYSDLIAVPIPDILPPLEPTLHSCITGKGQITLQWSHSLSTDVSIVRLFRRAIESDLSWTELAVWNYPDFDSTYVDETALPLIEYAYVMMTEDFTGYLSDPCSPMVCIALPDPQAFPLNQFSVAFTDDSDVQIDWNFPDIDIFQVEVFRKVNQDNWHLWRQLEPPLQSLKDKVAPESEHTYRIRIIFQDGSQTNFSAPKIIKS
jgi:hypothetical protein